MRSLLIETTRLILECLLELVHAVRDDAGAIRPRLRRNGTHKVEVAIRGGTDPDVVERCHARCAVGLLWLGCVFHANVTVDFSGVTGHFKNIVTGEFRNSVTGYG